MNGMAAVKPHYCRSVPLAVGYHELAYMTIPWHGPAVLDRFRVVLLLAVGLAVASTAARADDSAALVRQGKSSYTIHHDASLLSVRIAADELQRCIYEATGVRLPMTTEMPDGPVISLGNTPAARKAGLTPANLTPGQYRIVTRKDSLYIFGNDTPDDQYTSTGGRSEGTLHGVYAFLEKYVGVRWLLPGDVGEDIPATESIDIPNIDITYTPAVLYRRLPYINNRQQDVQTWLRRQRITPSPSVWPHGHNFSKVIPLDQFDKHPEWFPLIDGKREKRYQLEIANPEVVQQFVTKIREYFDENPHAYCFSLSGEDLQPWSQSPEAKKEYTREDGSINYTRMVVNFYNNVAKQVAQTHPDKIVSGYAYAEHLEPPVGEQYKLHPNLRIVIAYSPTYGYGLYSPKQQREFDRVFHGWSKLTDTMGHYDLPCNFKPEVVLTPTALPILDFIARRMQRFDIDGMYIYGIEGWGYGGATNYLWAKIYEDPAVNLKATLSEYYARMYGPRAGRLMDPLNTVLSNQFAKVYGTSGGGYQLAVGHLQTIYQPVYRQMEELLLKAKSYVDKDSVHAERLAMFERNMALLHWTLRRNGLLPVQTSETCEDSPLRLDDEQILAIMRNGYWRDIAVPRYRLPNIKDQAPNAVTVKALPSDNDRTPQGYYLRGNQRLLLYANTDAKVGVGIHAAKPSMTGYRLIDSDGNVLSKGIVNPKEQITFNAKPEAYYFLDVYTVQAEWFSISLNNLSMAIKSAPRLHLMQQVTPMYFYVSDSRESFDVVVETGGGPEGGETVLATLYDPSGTRVAEFDTSTSGTIKKNMQTRAGLWKMTFQQAPKGGIDDVYVQLDDTLPQWFMPDQQRQIVVTPKMQ